MTKQNPFYDPSKTEFILAKPPEDIKSVFERFHGQGLKKERPSLIIPPLSLKSTVKKEKPQALSPALTLAAILPEDLPSVPNLTQRQKKAVEAVVMTQNVNPKQAYHMLYVDKLKEFSQSRKSEIDYASLELLGKLQGELENFIQSGEAYLVKATAGAIDILYKQIYGQRPAQEVQVGDRVINIISNWPGPKEVKKGK